MAFTQIPDKTEKIFSKAMHAYNANNARQAEALFRKILRKNKMHLDANFMLGNLYAMNGKPKSALKYLKQAEMIMPDSVQTLNNIANVYRILKKDEEAVKYYSRVLKIDPGFTAAIQNLGFCNFKLKRYDKAINFFSQHLDIEPEHPDSLLALGEIYVALDETEKASDILKRCRELGAGDLNRIELLLAKLGTAPLPERYPVDMTVSTYRNKAENWDQDANRKDNQYCGPQLIEDALRRCKLKGGKLSILDLGCGTGGCATFLRPLAKQLTGIDLSPEMLAVAQKKRLYDELLEMELGEFLTNTKEDFDLITAAGVFILVGSLETSFCQVNNVLMDDGFFILTLYKGDSGVSLRHNLHFAHGRDHVLAAAEKSGLHVEMLEEVIHETDNGITQPGLVVVLKK